MRWYAVQTYAGQETKVVQYVQEFIDNGDLDGIITRVISPSQDVVQVKNGKKIKTTRKFFPGYVLIEMDGSTQAVHFVRSVNGVTDFVGVDKKSRGSVEEKILPLSKDEVSRILGQAEQGEKQQISEVPFEIGDTVKIKDGPFKGFDGVIEEVSPEKGKVKAMVSVFGRSTPVELDFTQVSQIS